MAKKRSIRRGQARSRKKNNQFFFLRFLPETAQAFMARRFVDLLALGLVISGLYVLLALFSYNSADPSWNTALPASEAPKTINWMGDGGAWLSDLLLQTVGLGSLVIGTVLIAWAYRAYRREGLSPLWARSIALLAASLCLSVALARVPAGEWMPGTYMGSSFGVLTLNTLSPLGATIHPWLGVPVLITLTVMGFIFCFAYAIALKRTEIAFLYNTLKTALLFTIGISWAVISGFIGWVRQHNDADYRPDPFSLLRNLQYPQFKAEEPSLIPQRQKRTAPSLTASASEEDLYRESVQVTPSPARTAATIPVVTKPAEAIKPKPRTAETTQQRFALSEGEEWEFPCLSLLESPPEVQNTGQPNEEALRKNAELLQNVLFDFGVVGEIVSIHPGPVVTLYELEPAAGVKSQKVISLADDIARSMSAISVRVAVVPGRNVIGIELPNKKRQIVYMQEMLASETFEKTRASLPLALGKDIGGKPILADLAKMPHLLVAGTTGSGKSVAVNTMILSLLYHLSPEQCRFIMIDPKMLELSVYDGIPHLLAPVVTEPGKAVVSLKWTVHEMEERYRAMSKLGVRNIDGYNERVREAAQKGETIMQKVQTGFDIETGKPVFEQQAMDLTELPYIVVIVDEFADLMLVAGKDVESAIQRLAQMARAAGIHLIMATQRPSVDVITGVVKANFPTRISFQVTSKIDSRTILGEGGAEQLLGMGDMLYMAPGGRITRVHGPFVSDSDVEKVVNDLKAKAEPNYIESVTSEADLGDSEIMNAMFGGGGSSDVDELYDQAVALVAREGKASTSFIQRYLQIGYNRAARIIEEMERQGVVSKATATGKREVLVSDFSDA